MKNFAKPLLVLMLVIVINNVLVAQSGAIGYFIAMNGQQTGPYDLVAMKDMIQKGTLTRTSLIWKDGMANWVEAATVQEVSALFTGAPPPLPSAQAPVVPPPISPQTVPSNTVYKIGDRGPAGGFIFFDKGFYSDGWRYLEAAPEDCFSNKGDPNFIRWAPDNFGGMFSAGNAVGTGKENTRKTVEALVAAGQSDCAAQLCFGATFGGYNDWFLPSFMELKLVYQNLKLKSTGGLTDDAYWSSTLRGVQVNYVNFKKGKTGEDFARYVARVRAIRMF